MVKLTLIYWSIAYVLLLTFFCVMAFMQQSNYILLQFQINNFFNEQVDPDKLLNKYLLEFY